MSSGRKPKKFGKDSGAQGAGGDARAHHEHHDNDGHDAIEGKHEHGGDFCAHHDHGRRDRHEHGGDRERMGRFRGMFSPHSNSPAEHAMAALMMTAKMIAKFGESRISQNKKYHKLSGPRMGVLFIVHHTGGIRMGDLAAKLHVAPRTVTDLVDGLERDGFLHRVPDPKDRRASILELSDMAKKDFDHIAKLRSAFVEEIFSPLSGDEKQALVALLDKLREGPIRELIASSSTVAQDSKASEIRDSDSRRI